MKFITWEGHKFCAILFNHTGLNYSIHGMKPFLSNYPGLLKFLVKNYPTTI